MGVIIINNVTLKKTQEGWEVSFSVEQTQTEKFADLDAAVNKLRELETAPPA